MPVNGFFAGLLAKLAGASTAAKAALAGATAVTTMAMAGGAAGILPGPAQTLVASAVNAATPFEFPGAGDATATVDKVVGTVGALPAPVSLPGVPAAPPVSVAAKAGSTSASASASVSAPATPTAPAAVPPLPGVPGVPALPQVAVPPAVSNLVNGLPACVKNLIPTGGGAPDPTKLAAQIPGCITQVLGTASLPPEVAKCVSSILGSIGGASGMNATSVPSIGSLNVSSCVPLDSSKCVAAMTNLLATLPNLRGGGLPTAGNIPNLGNLSSLSACVPMNITACLTSLTSAASAGTTPKLDLSACMPTGLPTTGLPGTGSLPGLPNLPGLSGALPFFGK